MPDVAPGEVREISKEGFWARVASMGLRRTRFETDHHVRCIGHDDLVTTVRKPDGLTQEGRADELRALALRIGFDLPNFWDKN